MTHFNFYHPHEAQLRVPHMGWAEVEPVHTRSLFKDLAVRPRFYFAHSYYVACREESDVLARARHGMAFAAALAHDNLFGGQVHPEKSLRFGVELLNNFAAL